MEKIETVSTKWDPCSPMSPKEVLQHRQRSRVESVMMDACVFCRVSLKNGEEITQLREKGCNTVNRTSQTRNDTIVTTLGQKVHQKCRRDYINANSIKRDMREKDVSIPEPTRDLRSSTPDFEFQKNCLFCGYFAKFSESKRGIDVFPVRTTDFSNTLRNICKERNDEWSEIVLRRLNIAPSDLHAADAIYHQTCSVNFRTGKQIPVSKQANKEVKRTTPGRPKEDSSEKAFLQIVRQLEETQDELASVSDIVQAMEDICGDKAYSVVHMKKRLQTYFGSDIIITEVNGKPNIVTFRRTASSILNEFYRRPSSKSPEEEKLSMIETAAKLIKADIMSLKDSKAVYPSSVDINSEQNIVFVPDSLQTLLRALFSQNDSSVKVASVGQAIIQASRPRTLIAPLQIALSVQMHHHFGSRFLLDTLNTLGFASSYTEVQRFELNAAAAAHDRTNTQFGNGTFVQYIADNVDHNLRTLDGHGTFHGMGMIAAVTPGFRLDKAVPRLSPTLKEVSDLAKINIEYYKMQSKQSLQAEFATMHYEPNMIDTTWKLDLLSKVCWPLTCNRPSWPAIMHKVMDGDYPGKSSVVFLPMIDMNPSDLTCINSTLNFIGKHAKAQHCVPILTFDQPLYWKAMNIIKDEPLNSPLKSVILRLGGFHLEMSFVGGIGHLMEGSGITELLETVYAPNAVTHMTSGKAIARAVRAHFLIDTALTSIILSHIYGIPLPDEIENETGTNDINPANYINTDNTDINAEDLSDELHEADAMLDELLKGDISVEKACDNVLIDQIKSRIDNFRESHKSFRTSQLWFQYMDMIDILRRFIKAERTGNWELHLQTVKDMLPYLAASGHNLYVKSSRVYLQQMENLKTTHPEVLAFLQSGHHVIRRSDKFWAGLSSDLVIEQVLMRSLKTTGGMTRGRGMSEGQRAQWILSMPDCAEMNNALQEFTGVNYGTSEQHKEGGESRRSRDCQDLKTFLSFLISRSPFVEETSLRNIETGVSADKFVNVDNSKELGIKILKSMDGKKIDEFSFKRKEQATILSAKSAIKVDDDVIIVDSQLLFQRFLAASNGIYEDQSEIFTYELCSHPSSMFDPNGLMRTAQKSSLADAIWGKGDCCAFEMSENDETQYVIDGGSLLHRIHWQSGLSFGEICQRYIDSVERKYSKAIVVFDGYASGPDTKDATHQRRTKGIIGTKVTFTDRTPFKSKKEMFLANIENKQNFINLLSAKMVDKGIKTKHADADADVLIALTAIESAKTKPTVLLGEDTDLLVLLLHHADVTSNSLIFKSGNVSKLNTHIKIWDILKTKLLLGEEICTLLPLIHAISGCDTTSRMFGVSKAATLKKFGEHDFLKTQAQLLCNANAKDDVISAGENIISSLYNGAPYEGLNVLRYRKFAARVLTNKTCVQIHTLPPTSNAASFHSQRAYLQMKMWMNKDTLNPCEWGWKVANGNLVPVKSTMDAAPSKLLNIIRCNCKTNCDTKRCTCRKNGLECSVACGELVVQIRAKQLIWTIK